jgi:peroxiredoxin
MKNKKAVFIMKKNIYILLILIFILVSGSFFAQQPKIKEAAKVGHPMPYFKLTSYQGEDISISQLKGKNILLLFPRGRFMNQWCRYGHYQYAELVDLEKRLQIRKKYNLEIIQVLPYTKEEIKDWVKDFQRNLGEIENWKYPKNPGKISEGMKAWMQTARKAWPKKFDYSDGKTPLPFPILIDADRKVSIGLELFRTEWNVNRAEQNVPTIYIIDKNGILQFKYISQSTMDRPAFDYIFKFIQRMIINK